MVEQLSLIPNEEDTSPLDFGSGEKQVTLPEEIVSDRAIKYDIALGGSSPGVESTYATIAAQQEMELREAVADKRALNFGQVRENLVGEVLSTRDPSAPFSQVELEVFKNLTEDGLGQARDLGSVMETEYAKNFIEGYFSSHPDLLDAGGKEQNVLDVVEWTIGRQQIAANMVEELRAELGEMSWPKWGWEFFETVIPFNSSANLTSAVPDFEPVSWLRGNNMEEQIAHLYTLPPEEFAQTLKETIRRIKSGESSGSFAGMSLASGNVMDAAAFASAVVEFSTTDQWYENLYGALDVADLAVGPLIVSGKLAGRVSKAALTSSQEKLVEVSKGLIKTNKNRTLNASDMLDETGDIVEAATLRSFTRNASKLFDGQTPRVKELEASVPSIARPWEILRGGSRALSDALVARLANHAVRKSDDMLQVLNDTTSIDRLTEASEELGQALALKEVQDTFTHVNHHAMGVEYVKAEDTGLANLSRVAVVFGRKGGSELFKTKGAARNFLNTHIKPRTNEASVVPEGNGYVVKVFKDVDETDNRMMDLLTDSENSTPTSAVNALIGSLRTAKDVTSKTASGDRLKAVQTQSALAQAFSNLTSNVVLSGKKKKRLMRVLKNNRDTVIDGKRGQFYNTVSELEDAYIDIHEVLPSEEEITAYFDYVRANDFDLVLRDYSWYRAKARAGIENFTWKTGNTTFEGRKLDALPSGKLSGSIAFDVDDSVGTARLESLGKEGRKRVKDALDDGAIIISPSSGWVRLPSDRVVNYVVTKNYQRDRVGLMNVDRRPGGHKIEKYPFYVKIARTYKGTKGESVYVGDQTIANGHTLGEAQKAVESLEKARKLFATGEDVSDLVEDTTPLSYKEFVTLFDPKKGGINPNSPFTAVRSGKRVSDERSLDQFFGSDWQDVLNSPHNIDDRISRRFAGERDVENVRILTEENGSLTLVEQDNLLDPLRALESSLSQLIGAQARDDYFVKSVNSWITEFQDVLDVGLDEMRRNPTETFFNPRWKEDVTDTSKLGSAKAVHKALQTSMQVRDSTAKHTEALKARLGSMVYDRFGEKTLDFYNDKMVPFIDNPVSHMRAFAFHSKLGLFNPVQLVLQAQSMTNIIALSPKQGVKGMSAYAPTRALLLSKGTPELVEHYAGVAAKMGWEKSDFIESYKALKASNWNILGGEAAFRDDMSSGNILQGPLGKALNSSAIFFNEGERLVRISSWHTAYSEWRALNPKARLDRRASNAILNRADDLSVNMTNASNAMWQKGLLGVPTQFFTYAIRLSELFFSKRISHGDRLRMLATYSAMYGVPIGATVGVPFLDLENQIRSQALKMGVPVNDSVLTEVLMDGIPAMALEIISGKDWDVGARLGPGSLTPFDGLLRGDDNLFDVIAGPSGSIAKDVFTSSLVTKATRSLLSDDPRDDFPITTGDIVNVLSNISSINQARGTWAGVVYGAWLSKNGMVLDEVTTPEAIFRGISGVGTQEETDAFLQMEVLRRDKEHTREIAKLMEGEYRKAFRARDPIVKEQYLRSAKAYGILLSSRERARVFKNVAISDTFPEGIQQQLENRERERLTIQKDAR